MKRKNPSGRAGKKRLLIVEDDPQMVEFYEFFTRSSGYAFKTLMKGRKAVETAKRSRFDLVILDVVLRDSSGYKIAQQITETLGERCPPILMATSRDTAKERGLFLLSGATAVLQKPFGTETLRQTVAELLDKSAKRSNPKTR